MERPHNKKIEATGDSRCGFLHKLVAPAPHLSRSAGRASLVRRNAALTAFAAFSLGAKRASEQSRFTNMRQSSSLRLAAHRSW